VNGQVSRVVATLLRKVTVSISVPQSDTTITFDSVDTSMTAQGTTGITYNAGTFTNSSGRVLTVLVTYMIAFTTSNSSGTRQVWILYNNTTRFGQLGTSGVTDFNNSASSAVLILQPNDYFVIRAWQNSGSTLTVGSPSYSQITLL